MQVDSWRSEQGSHPPELCLDSLESYHLGGYLTDRLLHGSLGPRSGWGPGTPGTNEVSYEATHRPGTTCSGNGGNQTQERFPLQNGQASMKH